MELLALTLESLQQREEHWVIADLAGKAGHVRTVPVATWVKATIDAWTTAAAIAHGTVFRAINDDSPAPHAKLDIAADDAGITPEAPTPDRVAEHHHSAWVVV